MHFATANDDCKLVNQLSQNYTPQELLDFYYRVRPVMAQWLAKPVWTASEAAMLCAGYVPHPNSENSAKSEEQDSPCNRVPIDPQGYIEPNPELYSANLDRLKSKEAASPLDMVRLLQPTSRKASLMNLGGQRTWVEMKRPFNLQEIKKLQWFFIIANAVGLPVPAIVPFRMLNTLLDQGAVLSKPISASREAQDQLKATAAWSLDGKEEWRGAVFVPHTTTETRQRKSRERQPLPTTPKERGYYTTEEVAGLINLLPATLNQYARQGKLVTGFVPFKDGRKVWKWRVDPQ